MDKVFALVLNAPSQKALIDKHCEDCPHLMWGALIDDELGIMKVCKKEVCRYEEKRMEFGECIDGIVWLRKLKAGRSSGELLAEFLSHAAPGNYAPAELFYPDDLREDK